MSICIESKSDPCLALSLTHSLSTVVKTWLMWLWLLNMPTENLLTLVLLLMFVWITGYWQLKAWQQLDNSSELACPCLVWSVTFFKALNISGPLCLWQCFRFKAFGTLHFCQESGHFVEKQTTSWQNCWGENLFMEEIITSTKYAKFFQKQLCTFKTSFKTFPCLAIYIGNSIIWFNGRPKCLV